MIFENVLDQYREYVDKKAPKRKFSKIEKFLNVILIVMAVILLIGTIWCGYTGNVKLEGRLIAVVVSLSIIAIFVNEYLFRKSRNQRKILYYERLKKLEEMLKKNHWNSDKKLEILIEWSDSYSKTDSPWVKELEPFGKIATVFILPVLVFLFQEIYEANEELKMQLLIVAFLLSLLGGVLVQVVIPSVRDMLNSREKLAECMKNDLKQLQLDRQLKQ